MTVVTFTTTGAQSWTVPAGVTSIDVACWAGGGGGGVSGWAGGGGAFAGTTGLAVTAGATVFLNVGAGGAGGNNSTSTDGGVSWANISANSAPGSTAAGALAAAGTHANGSSAGGKGGTTAASIGTTLFAGGDVNHAASNEGGGGGAGSAGAGGTSGGSGTAPGGAGGTPDGGAGGTGSLGTANPGTAPGGGGGCGNPAGGAGGAGQITITYTAGGGGGTAQHMAANATAVATATGTLAAGITVAARWNSGDATANAVITNAGLTLGGTANNSMARSGQFESSGQKYVEFVIAGTDIREWLGFANASETLGNFPGSTTNSIGYNTAGGLLKSNNTTLASAATSTIGDTIAFYLDFSMGTTGTLWLYKNNVQTGTTGVPGVSGGVALPSGPLALYGDAQILNAGLLNINATTTYTPFTGFTGFGNGLATSDHMAATATSVATASGAVVINFHLAAGATSTATGVAQLGGGTDLLAANAASLATATANARLSMHLSAAGTSLAAAQAGLSVTHNLAAAAISIASASAALFDQPQDHLAAAASSIAIALAGVEVKHHMAAAAASLATMAGTLGMHIFQHLGAAAVGTVTASGYLFPPDGLITQDLLMSSIVDICNQALGAVGTRSSIASLTEPSKEAQTCLLFYDNVRQSILRAAHWNFARATTTGALLKAAPGTPENNVIDTVGVWKSAYPPPPWTYSYAKPTDCLAVRQVKWQTGLNTSSGVPFMSGGMSYSPYQHATLPVRYSLASDKDAIGNNINVILANAPSALIEYTQDITNPTLWDPLFLDCVVAALAAAMTPQLNGDPRRKKALLEEANENIVQARIANGNDELDIQNIPPEAIMARTGYGIDLQLGMAPYGPLLRL